MKLSYSILPNTFLSMSVLFEIFKNRFILMKGIYNDCAEALHGAKQSAENVMCYVHPQDVLNHHNNCDAKNGGTNQTKKGERPFYPTQT